MPSFIASLPATVQPPTILWADPAIPTPFHLQAILCPNCGSSTPKLLTLTVDLQLPNNAPKRFHALRCPACTCHFYDSQIPPDYAEPELNSRGRVPFYVQQGAGISLIIRPLARTVLPAGSTYMEIGCGYGFGLDFACNTRNWDGIGIDPAPLAALGRDALKLPIELRYLREDDEARGTMDVVMGSEVIEHVTSPAAFIRTLRAMLKPGGLLILTTPNGDAIEPASPPGIIIPLLSPSLHLVIQSMTSLTALLRKAGFAHVDVKIDSHSLVAFASDAPLVLERDHDRLRQAYRSHLARRAEAFDPLSDVFLGLAGRSFQESVNDGDMDGATHAWSLLRPACQRRFGLDLDNLDVLPTATCDLEELALLMPLNLAGLLYSRGIQRLNEGVPRPDLERLFTLAAAASTVLRRGLNQLAMEDGQTEDIGWTAMAEALLCAAVGGASDIAARLAVLPGAPNGGEARRRTMVGRAVSSLVNAGHYRVARSIVQRERLTSVAGDAPMTDSERDLTFSLAVLDVLTGPDKQSLGNLSTARQGFAQVRGMVPVGSDLWWAAFRGELQALDQIGDGAESSALLARIVVDHPMIELGYAEMSRLVNAGHYEAAREVVRRSRLGNTDFAQPGSFHTLNDNERDCLFFLAVLDAQIGPDGRAVGEPAVARNRFARVRATTPPGSDLWWAALRGELQSLDLMNAQHEAAALVAETQNANPELDLPNDIALRIATTDDEIE